MVTEPWPSLFARFTRRRNCPKAKPSWERFTSVFCRATYHSLGEYGRAVEYDEQALTTAREIGHRQGEGIALWNMSLTLEVLGERQQAIEHAEAALVIYEQIEDPWVGKVRKQIEEWKG
jgi:tetratricopeptide (TPR) repeat protein